jgi:hypothetical protein
MEKPQTASSFSWGLVKLQVMEMLLHLLLHLLPPPAPHLALGFDQVASGCGQVWPNLDVPLALVSASQQYLSNFQLPCDAELVMLQGMLQGMPTGMALV